MLPETKEAGVSPVAGVVLLIVDDERGRSGHRIGTSGEIVQVGNPAFLVDDQVLHYVQVLRPGLRRQPSRRVAVGTAVVHVHVEIAAVPPSWPEGRPAARATTRTTREELAATLTVRRTTRYSGPWETSTLNLPAGTVTVAAPDTWKYPYSNRRAERS